MFLGASLRSLKNIEYLNLDYSGIKDDGLIALSNGLKKGKGCEKICLLSLKSNDISDKGCIYFAEQCLSLCMNLEQLDFNGNDKIGLQGLNTVWLKGLECIAKGGKLDIIYIKQSSLILGASPKPLREKYHRMYDEHKKSEMPDEDADEVSSDEYTDEVSSDEDADEVSSDEDAYADWANEEFANLKAKFKLCMRCDTNCQKKMPRFF